MSSFYTGIVENRSDPLRLGRCQVRIVGLHTHDKNQLPTADLPWSMPVQPIGSAAMNGIGYTPVGPVEGTTVIIMFADPEMQYPIMLGTVGGISTAPKAIDDDDSGSEISSQKTKDIVVKTVPGPTNGKQLTLYDPENGSTNLTSDLKANMRVIGHQMIEGTYIVSVDNGTQITISQEVLGYEENILTFEDPPTNLNAVASSKVENVLTDSSGKPVLDGSGSPVRTAAPAADATTPETPKSSATNDTIPTIPPAKSSSNVSKSTAGIKALIAACDKVGLTTKEQKCALLGIAGGESTWMSIQEAYSYNEDRLKQIFKVTDEEAKKWSNAPSKGITREQFFSWIYGPTKRGKGFLGNQTDADGGKYFGRGFIQLTGRSNYKRYNDLANQLGLGINILDNPDSLDNDINVSALVAALYIKDRVPASAKSTDHPGYFYAAKKAVGINSPDIAARKLAYYEYFYGTRASTTPEKDAAPPAVEPPKDGSSPTPGPSTDSTNSGSNNTGFRDPNNKYPLKDYLNEPDTNRLARGIKDGTVIEKKDGTRVTGVPKANGEGSWEQPLAPYGAQYPYNKVMETESGHVQEWDDTPGQERIHTYHRSGTFTEIDSQGTQVNFIVGDNFLLMERNGCIEVKGECNITVDGTTNIYARSDANIQVEANANITVGNNLDIGVANDVYMAAGGDFLIKAAGDFNVQAANINQKADSALAMQGGEGVSVKGDTVNVESAGSMDLLAGGTLQADYSEGQFGNGASGASDVEPVELTPPAAGKPVNPIVPFLIPPDRKFEEKANAESPQDLATPEGRAAAAQTAKKDGTPDAAAPVASESSPPPAGGTDAAVPVSCEVIYQTKNFTNDFRMSKNFTLGMLICGGVGGDHKLQDQMLSDNPNGKPLRLYTIQEIMCNLATTAQNLLEPIVDILPGGIGGYKKQWIVSSGYRLKGVIPFESPTSSHCKGFALDIALITPDRFNKTYELVQKIEKVIPYDQLILEYRHSSQCWIHLGYAGKGVRKQAFTMVNDSTYQGTFPKGGFVLVNSIPPPLKKT
jgi:predicted chitinase